MIIIPEWSTPAEIERDIPVIRQLREYWESLNDGLPPERDQIDPEVIKGLLPWMLLADFEFDPFRVRYRLTGTQVDKDTGYNLTGKYLDEYLLEPLEEGVGKLQQAYERVWRSEEPFIGTYQWSGPWPVPIKMPFGIFPLKVRGKVKQALGIEQLPRESVYDDVKTWRDYLAIQKAGGPSKRDLMDYR
nr:F29 [uncultured bacterium]